MAASATRVCCVVHHSGPDSGPSEMKTLRSIDRRLALTTTTTQSIDWIGLGCRCCCCCCTRERGHNTHTHTHTFIRSASCVCVCGFFLSLTTKSEPSRPPSSPSPSRARALAGMLTSLWRHQLVERPCVRVRRAASPPQPCMIDLRFSLGPHGLFEGWDPSSFALSTMHPNHETEGRARRRAARLSGCKINEKKRPEARLPTR
jgi:hypothetical protein